MINRPGVAGAVLQSALSLIYWVSEPFPHNLQNIRNHKPEEPGSWNFERMFLFTPHNMQCSHWEIIGCEFWPGKASEGKFCELFCKMCIKCDVKKWKIWGFVNQSLLEAVLLLHKERFVFPFKCECNFMNFTRLDNRSIGQMLQQFQTGLFNIWTIWTGR